MRERYRPFLQWALQHHLLVAGFFLVMLSLSLSLYGGGWLRSAFSLALILTLSKQNHDAGGGSFSQSELVMQRVLDAAEALKSDWNERPEYQDSPAIGNILGRADNAVVVVATVSEGVDTEAFACSCGLIPAH